MGLLSICVMESALKDKSIEVAFNLVNEFKQSGILSHLFLEVTQNLPYPLPKFQMDILVFNLALTLVEDIYKKFPSEEVSVSEITTDLVRL